MQAEPHRSLVTRALHGCGDQKKNGSPFLAGPTFASTYHLAGDPAGENYQYGRFSNPTWSELEGTIGELEDGPAIAFASGMAAISATLTAFVQPGDTVVIPEDGYFATRVFARTYLARWGIKIRQVPTTQMRDTDFNGARLVLIETPSNPGLDVCEIGVIAAAAHAAGAIVAVDNTTATVLSQSPLRLGADLSVASDSKAFNGHSDVIFGHVAVRDTELLAPIREWRTLVGAIPGPMETWLVHRSLATLELRIARQSETAQALAELLANHPAVTRVRYPGLPSDPAYGVARRQMRYSGGIIGFELISAATAQRFLSSCALLFEATSFGGVHTSAERRGRWNADHVAEGFIRLSIGCESRDDLLSAMVIALEQASNTEERCTNELDASTDA
jgi:cystathionine gamma-lyase